MQSLPWALPVGTRTSAGRDSVVARGSIVRFHGSRNGRKDLDFQVCHPELHRLLQAEPAASSAATSFLSLRSPPWNAFYLCPPGWKSPQAFQCSIFKQSVFVQANTPTFIFISLGLSDPARFHCLLWATSVAVAASSQSQLTYNWAPPTGGPGKTQSSGSSIRRVLPPHVQAPL